MKTITLKVEGMKCEGCENRIQKRLSLFHEIKEVKASHKTKEVTINYEKEINQEAVKKAIDDLGFQVL